MKPFAYHHDYDRGEQEEAQYEEESDSVLSLLGQTPITQILQSLTAKSPIRLSWTHYNIIQQELTANGFHMNFAL